MVEAEVHGAAAAPENRAGTLKILHRLQCQIGHGYSDRGGHIAGCCGDGTGAWGGGGKITLLINRADSAVDLPGKCSWICLQRDAVVSGGGCQLGDAAGRGAQRCDRRAAGIADHHICRIGNGVDGCRSLPASGLCCYHNISAGPGRCHNAAIDLTLRDGEAVIPGHGNEIGVNGGSGNIHGAAGQNIVIIRTDIEVAQLSAGRAVCHQENLVGHGALTAVRRLVDGAGGQLVRLCDRERRGAAAVQTQGRHTAQLNQPLGHLSHRGSDGMSGPAAVNGVEHQRTVRLLSNGGTGRRASLQARDHCAVFYQGIQRTQRILHIVPSAVGRRGGEYNLAAHRDIFQCVHIIGVRLQVC